MMEGRPRRRPPLWLFLLVLLAAVSIWAWRLRSGAPAGETEAHLAAGPQFEDPVRLVFETAGDSIVVVSTATGYTIVHPVHDLASTLRVKDVARNAMLLAPSRSLHEPPERFGLVPPQHRLRLVAPSGAVWSIAMGDSSAVGSEVYAQLGELGSPVVLIREFTARHYFAPDVDALRDPTALPLSSPVIDSLHVIVSGASLRARRVAADHWEAMEPAGVGLDPLPINRVLRELRGPGMTGFDANLTPADAGLDPPRARWIAFQGARSETVSIGSVTDSTATQLYVQPAGRSVIGRMSSDFFRDLVDGWPGLARRQLLDGSADSLRAISFLTGGDGGGYRREHGSWLREPSGVKVRAQEALSVDLDNLTKLRWGRYPVDPVHPHGDRLTLRLEYPAAAETLWLAGTPGDSTASCRSNSLPRWGTADATQFRIWRYRSEHPDM